MADAIENPEMRSLAVAAASQATEGTAELLRFAREGEGLRGPFETEVVEQLLDAAKLAMEIEGWNGPGGDRAEVYAAVCQFLEGWA